MALIRAASGWNCRTVAPAMERLVQDNRSDPALRRSEHKRWQMGVILKVSQKSFGTGRVRVNGRWLSKSDWQGETVRELFFTLAAIIRAPYYLSPYDNKEGLLARKDYILKRMVTEGYLTEEEAEKAKNQNLNFAEKKIEIKAPYFTLWVRQQLEEKYGKDFLRESGLKIYTTLDWTLQGVAEEAVKEGFVYLHVFSPCPVGWRIDSGICPLAR
jgi:penicillin-binding protein 1A